MDRRTKREREKVLACRMIFRHPLLAVRHVVEIQKKRVDRRT